jgi:hypothetical protein
MMIFGFAVSARVLGLADPARSGQTRDQFGVIRGGVAERGDHLVPFKKTVWERE